MVNGETVSESCIAGFNAYCTNGSVYCMFICYAADPEYHATMLYGTQVCSAAASVQNTNGLFH